jgi:hypothetical protein
MGPLLLAGMAIFGATIAIGIIAAGTPNAGSSLLGMPPARRLALVLIAIAEGCGMIGVVTGLVAVLSGVRIDPASIATSVVIAFAGAVTGLAQLIRNSSDLDHWIVPRAAVFIGSLGALSVSVAILAAFISEPGGATPPSWAFLVLGAVSAVGSIGIGIVGTRSIADMASVDDVAARVLMSRTIARILPFEFLAVGSSMLGIVLIMSS